MFSPRRILALLILGSVAVLAVVLWQFLARQSPEDLLDALPKQVDLALDQLHYTQNEDGARSWTLSADKAEYQRDSGQALLDRVHLIFYRAGDFGEVTLDAGQGSLDQNQQQIEVWDRVTVRTGRQEQLLTERLHYDGRQQAINSEAPLRLVTPRMELTGVGFQVDLVQGRLLVKKAVRARLFSGGKEQ